MRYSINGASSSEPVEMTIRLFIKCPSWNGDKFEICDFKHQSLGLDQLPYYEDFRKALKDVLAMDDDVDFVIQFRNEDGDMIFIENQDELDVAMCIASELNYSLYLLVHYNRSTVGFRNLDENDIFIFNSIPPTHVRVIVPVRETPEENSILDLSIPTMSGQGDAVALPIPDEPLIQDGAEKQAEPVQNRPSTSSEGSRSDSLSESIPPEWFIAYMDKYRDELTKKICHKMQKVLLEKKEASSKPKVPTTEKSISTDDMSPKAAAVKSSKEKKDKGAKPKEPSTTALSGTNVATTSTATLATTSSSKSHARHTEVVCSNCKKEIWGVRYKCGNCLSVNLCKRCERIEDVHTKDHVFIKIKRPLVAASSKKFEQRKSPLIKHLFYEASESPSGPSGDQQQQAAAAKKAQKEAIQARRLIKKAEEDKAKSLQIVEPWLEQVKSLTPESIIAPTAFSDESAAEESLVCQWDAKFIRDETITDGTAVAPEQKFTKSWRIVNSGQQKWNADTKLVSIFENTVLKPSTYEVQCPPLSPGEEAIISVDYTAPTTEGAYESHWKFLQKGAPFGHRIWCSVVVESVPEKSAQVSIVDEQPASLQIELQAPSLGPLSQLHSELQARLEACLISNKASVTPMEENNHTYPDWDKIIKAKGLVTFNQLEMGESSSFRPQAEEPRSGFAQIPESSGREETAEIQGAAAPDTKNIESIESSPPSEEVVEVETEAKEGGEGEEETFTLLRKSSVGSIVSLSSCSSDVSEQEYVVVKLPPCFDLSTPLNQSRYEEKEVSEATDDKTVEYIDGLTSRILRMNLSDSGSNCSIFVAPPMSETSNQEQAPAAAEAVETKSEEVLSEGHRSGDDASTKCVTPVEEEEVTQAAASENTEAITAQPSTSAQAQASGVATLLANQAPEPSDFYSEGTVQILPDSVVAAATTVINHAKAWLTSHIQRMDASNQAHNQSLVDTLVEMGFDDRAIVEGSLHRFKYNIEAVVEDLLQKKSKGWFVSID